MPNVAEVGGMSPHSEADNRVGYSGAQWGNSQLRIPISCISTISLLGMQPTDTLTQVWKGLCKRMLNVALPLVAEVRTMRGPLLGQCVHKTCSWKGSHRLDTQWQSTCR